MWDGTRDAAPSKQHAQKAFTIPSLTPDLPESHPHYLHHSHFKQSFQFLMVKNISPASK